MSNLHSLRVRLIVVITLIVIAACAVLALSSMVEQTRLTDRALEREMRSEYQSVIAAFESEQKTFRVVATLMATDPDIRSALAARDRDRITAQLRDG
jgi:methyl-accepting chemotaxis protein